jgi:hypothetical protein
MAFIKKIKQLGEQFNLPQREVATVSEDDNDTITYNDAVVKIR